MKGQSPVALVKDGKAQGKVYVMRPDVKPSLAGHRNNPTNVAIAHLQAFIKEATGAELEVVLSPAEIVAPGIVVGNCPQARKAGLNGPSMPVEGFGITVSDGFVFIAGNDGADPAKPDPIMHGSAMGVNEFLERYVGARWYFLNAEIGLSIPKSKDLTIPAVSLRDAPAFVKRKVRPKPSVQSVRYGFATWFNRCNNRLPVGWVLRLGSSWGRVEDFREDRPEIFQLNADGSRDPIRLCYGHPKTLATFLEQIDRQVKQNAEGTKPTKAESQKNIAIAGNAIGVTPHYSGDIACACGHCQTLWDHNARPNGTASRIFATFVGKLATEVKKRWPAMYVCAGVYKNFFAAPKGVTFPDNVYINPLNEKGMAFYAQPVHQRRLQRTIDRWFEMSGHKLQFNDYCRWPGETTRAPFQYPNALQTYYRANREKIVGSQVDMSKYYKNYWTIQTISTYCWLRLLWNPDHDIDATINEFCRRMFGKAEKPMRELVQMQIDGWEKAVWPSEFLGAQAIYETAYPRKSVVKMELLLLEARELAAGDELVLRRIDHYAKPFKEFFKSSLAYAYRTPPEAFASQKTEKSIVVDGKLDEAAWKTVPGRVLIRARTGEKAKYRSEVKSVWDDIGITFGFDLAEPTPEFLEIGRGAKDSGKTWLDDNVEVFVDVTGKDQGEFYQFLLNSNDMLFDSKIKNSSWDGKGVKTASSKGKDRWSVEIYLPYSAFPDASVPKAGQTQWAVTFARHRVADTGRTWRKAKKKPAEGSVSEYQRLHTLPIEFITM
ncbi:MAG: DUF4838 domain-containing protein, partial [Planctomycetota bacterium]|nr:DUF4838 domain-containing protein [Planctomycetota bacterium]